MTTPHAFGRILRTPEERFAARADWPFAPRYIDDLPGFGGMRLHHVDEGKADAPVTFLCLHGEPSWSYLYRKMIPVFTAAGCRVVAPDWFGFGRSDKPADDAVYTIDFHRRTLIAFVERLNLANVCLVVQDWGGLIGLTYPMAAPDRVTRLLIMNTTIADGRPPSDGFLAWKAYAASQPDLAVGALMKRGTNVLTPADVAAYDAPFPDISYKGGVRRFPELVPIAPEMAGADLGVAARAWYRDHWRGESFMAVGGADPVLGPAVMEELRTAIPGCPAPMVIPEGGHFVQEWGAPIAAAALAHFGLD